jgi:hypothetical protein
MKKKVFKKYVYNGLGFPVILRNVPATEVLGEIVPDIKFNELQKSVLLFLCYKESPLTGNEVKFIRKYLRMTSTQFGAEFGCSHTAVLKWEKFGNRFAKIEPATDICIRLFALGHLHCKGNAFKRLYEKIKIQELAEQQKTLKATDLPPIDLNFSQKVVSY